jgi:lipopolysaccharide biosynthesis protein
LNWHRLNGRINNRVKSREDEQTRCELIEKSGLFDRAWYLDQYPELARSTCDPVVDYLRHGAGTGRDPNPLFDGEWYFAQCKDAQITVANPLVHYLLHGAKLGLEPSPFFDTQWYLAEHPELHFRLHAKERRGLLAQQLAPASCGESAELGTAADLQYRSMETSNESDYPLAHYLKNGWPKGALAFDPIRLLRGMKIAVIVHLFYADLWNEIAERLRNIPIEFDLFVSVPLGMSDALSDIVLRAHPQARLLEVANAGRDVGAFFAVLPTVLAGNYSVLCKLHSKKGSESPQAWRDLLLRGLLANKLLVSRILHAFACDPALALVGARDVYVSGTTQMRKNKANIEKIARLLYPDQSIPRRWGFFAGTMFWARPHFFQLLAQCSEGILSFESDNSRDDGQVAHAFERVFGLLAAMGGKHIGLTEVSGLRPLEGTIHITQAPGLPWDGSFRRVLRCHELRLSGELPVRRTWGPPDGARVSASRQEQKKSIARFQIPVLMTKTLVRTRAGFPRLTSHVMGTFAFVWPIVTLRIVSRLRDFCVRRVQARWIASSPLFDRAWYLERYPDVRAARVNPAVHYITEGAAGYRDPSPRFDTAWYLAYYADVAVSGVNPLFHYLRHGVEEGRHALPSEIVSGEVTDAALLCRKRAHTAGEVALFVTHSADGRLKPHVRHYLEALQRHGIWPVLIVATDRTFCELDSALLALLGGLYIRQNVGYDFAAWAHVLRENPGLLDAEILYLVNDSTIGPLNEQKFAELLRRMRSSKSDVIGLTDNYERGWHIQTYFIALKSAALSSPVLQAFVDKIKTLSEKRDVVNAYEARFAQILQASGLSCEVLFPAKTLHNASLVEWRTLIAAGLPFVKLSALRNSSGNLRNTDWRKYLQSEGFDYHLAEQALAARP